MKGCRAFLRACALCALLLFGVSRSGAAAGLYRLRCRAAAWELGIPWTEEAQPETPPFPEKDEEKTAVPGEESVPGEPQTAGEEPETAPPPEAVSPEAVPIPEEVSAVEGNPLPGAVPLTAEGKTLPAPVSEPKALRFGTETVTNRTGIKVDPEALLREPLGLKLKAESPQILIIHTHGTEAYTPSPGCEYESSDPYRTTDTARSVVRVGDELAAALSSRGLRVIHDRELYDYPSYTGSYNRSGNAAADWLSRFPDLAVIIDLHRDALGEGDTVYKTRAELSGEASAQVMLLVGTGENGLEHPDWRENFKLALQLQAAMKGTVPTLCRPVDLVGERYNQHLTKGSLILEVGSSGNTLPEALTAVRLFAEAAAPVFLSLTEN